MAYVIVVLTVLVLCYAVIIVGPLNIVYRFLRNPQQPGRAVALDELPDYDLTKRHYRVYLRCCRRWHVFSGDEIIEVGGRESYDCGDCGHTLSHPKGVLDRRCRWDVKRGEHIPTSRQ